MVTFTDFIYSLQYYGVADVLLPFILIFTIVFAILQKSKIFGDDPKVKQFNIIIALVLGLAVVFPHVLGWYPPQADAVVIINTALPNVSILLVAIIALLLIIGLFGGTAAWAGKLTGWVALLAFVIIVYIFGSAAGWFQYWPWWLRWLQDSDTQAVIIIIAVFAIIIWFVTKEPKEKKEGALGKFGEELGKLFGANK